MEHIKVAIQTAALVYLLGYRYILNVLGILLAASVQLQRISVEPAKVVIQMDALVRLPVYRSSLNVL